MTRSWWSKEERKVFQEEGQPMEEYFMYRREREGQCGAGTWKARSRALRLSWRGKPDEFVTPVKDLDLNAKCGRKVMKKI